MPYFTGWREYGLTIFNTLGILWLQKQSIKTEIFAQEIEINLPHYFDQSNNGTNILEIVHFMLS
jgi:hypothetical protein